MVKFAMVSITLCHLSGTSSMLRELLSSFQDVFFIVHLRVIPWS